MKYAKILALAAVAVAVLMALVGAGTASATVLCKNESCTETYGAGTTLKSSTGSVKIVLDAPFGNVECESTAKGKIEGAGSSTETVHGKLEEVTFANCGGDTVTTLKPGSIEAHTDSSDPNGTSGNGTSTSTGFEVTVIHLGVHCIYTTSGTDMGTIVGGNPSHLSVSASLPRTGGNGGAFCGSSAPLTGTFGQSEPGALYVK